MTMSNNFYTDVILKSTWAKNPSGVCKDMAMLEPGTRGKVQAMIADAKSHGHDLRVLETYRSQARQAQLFQESAKYKLVSGIDWGTPHAKHTFNDYDHVQNVPIFRQDDLFAGRWYPAPDYDPIEDSIKHGIKAA
jgi:hypothetical protein